MDNKPIPYLTTHKLFPENQESPIHFLKKHLIPKQYFFKRNHFSYPMFTDAFLSLIVYEKGSSPFIINYNQILQMPSKTLEAVLECAGNQRALFEPKVYGEQWENGAISQGSWTGVSLIDLFETMEINLEGKEIVFEAHDSGKHKGTKKVSYARSLPIYDSLSSNVLIAYKYNDKPIPFKHGGPLRLIVPQWYAMASVKWLKSIKIINNQFYGPFQTEDYVYYPHPQKQDEAFPVTKINVNSIIQKPLDYSELNTGTHIIEGIAWTGYGTIDKVELSFDQGSTWVSAIINDNVGVDDFDNYSWKKWSYNWNVQTKGEYMIYSRAHDSEGHAQPIEPFWNQKGYGYNAVNKSHIKII